MAGSSRRPSTTSASYAACGSAGCRPPLRPAHALRYARTMKPAPPVGACVVALTFGCASSKLLAPGARAPDFRAQDQRNETVTLAAQGCDRLTSDGCQARPGDALAPPRPSRPRRDRRAPRSPLGCGETTSPAAARRSRPHLGPTSAPPSPLTDGTGASFRLGAIALYRSKRVDSASTTARAPHQFLSVGTGALILRRLLTERARPESRAFPSPRGQPVTTRCGATSAPCAARSAPCDATGVPWAATGAPCAAKTGIRSTSPMRPDAPSAAH